MNHNIQALDSRSKHMRKRKNNHSLLPINLLYLCLLELQGYYLQTCPPPCYQVLLYFEQCHDIHTHRRPITVQVHTTIPFHWSLICLQGYI